MLLEHLLGNARCRAKAAALYEMDQQHTPEEKEQGSSESRRGASRSAAAASPPEPTAGSEPPVTAVKAARTFPDSAESETDASDHYQPLSKPRRGLPHSSLVLSMELESFGNVRRFQEGADQVADTELRPSVNEEQVFGGQQRSLTRKEKDSKPFDSFIPGQRCRTQRRIVMRTHEAFASHAIKYIEEGSLMEVLEKGIGRAGTRVFVQDESGQQGWVSVVSKDGSELLAPAMLEASSSSSSLPELIEGSDLAFFTSSTSCLCCYEEHKSKDMVRCPAGHAFCAGCVNQYVATAVEAGDDDFRCIATTGCDQAFGPSDLSAVVPSKVWELVQKRSLQRSIAMLGAKAARSDRMRACPFCELIAVVDDGDTIFRCTQCCRDSCLQCLEEAHPGLTCQEVKVRLNRRKTADDRMSEAIIRVCPWCQKVGVHTRFLLSDGCNKVTCPTCGQNSCYICGLEISQEVGYKHFCQHPLLPGEDCRECSKCRLFCDPEEADRIRMQRATESLEGGEEGFQICGSWDSWKLVEMRKEERTDEDGSSEMLFTHIFRLSRRNWEKFQIIRNGNWGQRLHPKVPCSGPNGQVIFSTDDPSSHGKDWLIDARSDFTDRPEDEGMPGELYRICLFVRGFWLRVNWDRLDRLPKGQRPSALPMLEEAHYHLRERFASPHSFWLVGSWADWCVQEMRQTQGSHVFLQFECLIVLPANEEGSFQILRNGEWDQRIYPLAYPCREYVGNPDGSMASGPDTNGHGKNWDIPAKHYERELLIKLFMFRHKQKRVWVGEADSESMRFHEEYTKFENIVADTVGVED